MKKIVLLLGFLVPLFANAQRITTTRFYQDTVYFMKNAKILGLRFTPGVIQVDANGKLTTSPAATPFNPIAGTGIVLTGTYPNITFTSTGGGAPFNAIAGSNMTITGVYPNKTFTPTVLTPIAGANIVISGTYPNLTFAGVPFNSIAGTNMTITGTYPNKTFTPTVLNPTAGSGVTITGSYPNLTFSAPGAVPLNATAGANMTITGVYPNLTFASTNTTSSSFVGVLSGGTGNGSTDDTAAINASLAAATTNSTVYLKQGVTYLISGTLTNSVKGVTLNMNGASIHSTATSGSIVQLTGLGTRVINGEAYGDFQTTDSFTPGTGLTGLRISNDSCEIVHVFVHNVQAYGILCASGNYVHPVITNSRVLDVGYTGFQYTLTSTSTNGGVFKDNIIDRGNMPPSTVRQSCVQIAGFSAGVLSQGWDISGNTFRAAQSPTNTDAECMELRYTTGGRISNNRFIHGTIGASIVLNADKTVISHNSFEGCIIGVELANVQNCTVSDNIIDGNSLASTEGILLDGSTGAVFNTITGNTIQAVLLDAVHIHYGSNDNQVTSNVFNCGVSGQKVVNILAAGRIGITGNRFYGAGLSSVAVVLDATSTSGIVPQDVIFNGNTVSDFTTAAVQVYVPRAVTVDGLIITSNIIKNSTATLVSTLSGGGALGANVVNTNNVP